MIALDTPAHIKLANILAKLEHLPWEMSIRPRISRAINELLQTPRELPEDIKLMKEISSNPPGNIGGTYEKHLRKLCELCKTGSNMYDGEAKWSSELLALSLKKSN